MYNEYFGFKEAPFSIAPDPRYLFMTPQHREALAHLVYGLNSEGGCLLLTGEVGTGKTTVCRCLLNQIPDKANIALVLNPKVTVNELLASICDELKIPYPQDATIKTYVDNINQFLIESHARGEKTVLIIDEAQNLDKAVLEQLRLLTNLETDQRKLLQIIILGQPELIDILSSDEMRQLAQRITARFHLKPLDKEDIKAYISHRLAVAGQNVQLFPDPTIKRLFSLSKGIPRLINILCDRALLGTYVQSKNSVDNATLEQAAKEVFGEIKNVTQKKNTSKSPLFAVAASVALAVAATLYYVYQHNTDTKITALDNVSDSTTTDLENVIDNPVPEHSTMDDYPTENNSQLLTKDTAHEPASFDSSLHDEALAEIDSPSVNIPAEVKDETERHDLINDFIGDSSNDNKAVAYAALFRTWGKRYDKKQHQRACMRATELGLSCLHKQGNLNSVRLLNRPAVMKLYNSAGEHAYAIITQLDEMSATLDTGVQRFKVSTMELDNHWLGEYTLLWQKPPYYTNALQPGNNGPMVQWLDQQMVRLYGYNDAPTISDTYKGNLISQVKKFQLSKGLEPDGVAGPLTFILLNTELGNETPRLNDTSDS